ncbi:MAG: aldo/keto reductase [Proteobacteria bacterium]|nr:aldo/keto reductase [Pseudomonadota bacterium]
MSSPQWTRRLFIAAGATLSVAPGIAIGDESMSMRHGIIPATGERLPVVGLGTYIAFDVDSTPSAIKQRKSIVDLLIAHGGSVIDTSPMYNRSEKLIGDVIAAGTARRKLFLATKVWTEGQAAGAAQMQRSADLMNSGTIDLMQVHNLRDTATHMASIRQLQDEDKVRYSGLTHYTAGALRTLETEMLQHKPEFIQINYSLGEREAAERILPLARNMGIAVLINRPFQSGALFRAVANRKLPDWAQDFAASWGQFFLKFILSHHAVTCAIPATAKPHHMIDNLGAGLGNLPDSAMRKRMTDYFTSL